jgi:RND family efflux transporter MFP subunit
MENLDDKRRLTTGEKIALTMFSIIILGISAGVSFYMINNKPTPVRRKPPPTELTVRVQKLNPASHQIFIPVMGTVIPAVQIDLRARAAGEVIWTNPEFVEGGIIPKRDVILKIDPKDYELALIREKAGLETAVYEYKIEQGRQEIAQIEWELLGLKEDAAQLDQELALRQPHLREKEVKLEAAKARVERSQLDLDRTVIRAPFNAIVRSVEVDMGGQASTQTTLATLVGTDTYRIQAAIPVDQLRWIRTPNSPGDEGSEVVIHTGTGVVRRGKVQKLLSDLEPSGRLARVLINVKDPLDLGRSRGERRPLLLGELVRLKIEGRTLQNVFVIPRDALRDGDKIWSVDDQSRLKILEVDVIWQDLENVLVKELDAGLNLVVSDIPAPVVGMKVKVTSD